MPHRDSNHIMNSHQQSHGAIYTLNPQYLPFYEGKYPVTFEPQFDMRSRSTDISCKLFSDWLKGNSDRMEHWWILSCQSLYSYSEVICNNSYHHLKFLNFKIICISWQKILDLVYIQSRHVLQNWCDTRATVHYSFLSYTIQWSNHRGARDPLYLIIKEP